MNFILKMFANSRFQFDQLEELRSSLNLKAPSFVEFILEDGKLVSDGISSHKNPTSINFKDG